MAIRLRIRSSLFLPLMRSQRNNRLLNHRHSLLHNSKLLLHNLHHRPNSLPDNRSTGVESPCREDLPGLGGVLNQTPEGALGSNVIPLLAIRHY